MRTAATSLLVFLLSFPVHAGETCWTAACMSRELTRSARGYAADGKSLTTAPLRWDGRQWSRFAEGMALVAALYATDPSTYETVQENRSGGTNAFARDITPFGAQRALEMSALLALAGPAFHQPRLAGTGRDALEAEVWAAGVVTPLMKRIAGRARPIQDEGARSFHPLRSSDASFPSGHATNVFAFASVVSAEGGSRLVSVLAYGVATGVALSRVNDRKHFPSDVVAGALIGRAVGRGVVFRHHRGRQWAAVPEVSGRAVGVLFHSED